MKERQQGSTNYPIGFMLVLKTDHITGATGKAGTIVLTTSKNGATFAPHDAASSIIETGYGWYNWTPAAADRDTLGELRIHVDEVSCDPYDEKYDIVQYDPYAFVSLPAAERTAMADAILTRDWTQVVGWPSRCLLQGLRLLRNKWSVNPATGVLTVTTEDNTTTAWQGQLTSQAGASPIVGQAPSS
jgi:hypothetical protein